MSNIPESQGCSQERAVNTTSTTNYPANQPMNESMNLNRSFKFTVSDNQRDVGEIYFSEKLVRHLNSSLQTELEASVTPVSYNSSTPRRQFSRTFRRLQRSVRLLGLFVAALSAVLKLPEILQKLLEHFPKLLEHLPF